MTYLVPNYQTDIDTNETDITNLIQFPGTIQTGASFTATFANKVIICNSASTPMTLNLPSITGSDLGKQMYIKNIHPTGTVSITPTLATIDDAATYLLDGQYEAVMLFVSPSDTPAWFILGSYNGTSP